MSSRIEKLISVLVDKPATSPAEVFRRCDAIDALAAMGRDAASAIPALRRTLVVPVTVDCGLALRVVAAAAIWKVEGSDSVVLPFMAWALKDEYWGVAPRAVAILSEIGDPAVVPDLIRLAERRLAHGPFHFEEMTPTPGRMESPPLLAAIAEALGRCARGRWEGQCYAEAARVTLQTLAVHDDVQVRESADRALFLLKDHG